MNVIQDWQGSKFWSSIDFNHSEIYWENRPYFDTSDLQWIIIVALFSQQIPVLYRFQMKMMINDILLVGFLHDTYRVHIKGQRREQTAIHPYRSDFKNWSGSAKITHFQSHRTRALTKIQWINPEQSSKTNNSLIRIPLRSRMWGTQFINRGWNSRKYAVDANGYT